MSIASQYIRGKGKKKSYASGINISVFADYPLPPPVFQSTVTIVTNDRVTATITSVLSITVA